MIIEGNTIKAVPRPALRVIVADRDTMSSDLLARALSESAQCIVSPAETRHLMSRLAAKATDIVVIGVDLDSASSGSLSLIASIHKSHPKAYIILLVDNASPDQVVDAFQSGARGVFSRNSSIVELVKCIEHVGNGHIWAGRLETNALLEALRQTPARRALDYPTRSLLTDREMQVVRCAAKGKTNKGIADELRLSEHTVKNYLFRAFEKLGVTSRVELLLYLTNCGEL